MPCGEGRSPLYGHLRATCLVSKYRGGAKEVLCQEEEISKLEPAIVAPCAAAELVVLEAYQADGSEAES